MGDKKASDRVALEQDSAQPEDDAHQYEIGVEPQFEPAAIDDDVWDFRVCIIDVDGAQAEPTKMLDAKCSGQRIAPTEMAQLSMMVSKSLMVAIYALGS